VKLAILVGSRDLLILMGDLACLLSSLKEPINSLENFKVFLSSLRSSLQMNSACSYLWKASKAW